MISSRKQRLKKAYDFLTLGWFKWWFFLGYTLCFIVSRAIYVFTSQNPFYQFVSPHGPHYPKSPAYWVYSGYLPLRFPDILFQWNFRWFRSDLFDQTSVLLVVLLFFVFLIAVLRGE